MCVCGAHVMWCDVSLCVYVCVCLDMCVCVYIDELVMHACAVYYSFLVCQVWHNNGQSVCVIRGPCALVDVDQSRGP